MSLGCIETITILLREFEPSIPCLPERMAVRMLRLVLENNLEEVGLFEKSMHWECFVRIFLMMRSATKGLSIAYADTCPNASKLCSVIYDGLKTFNENGSIQTESDLVDRCHSDLGCVKFVLDVYCGVASNLSELTQDEHFMDSMGPNGPLFFSSIIVSLDAVHREFVKMVSQMSLHSLV